MAVPESVDEVSENLRGGFNLHICLRYDDGVEWLARLPAYIRGHAATGSTGSSKRLRHSEVLTLQALLSVGVPVPQVFDWGCGVLSKSGGTFMGVRGACMPMLMLLDARCAHLIFQRMLGTESLPCHTALTYKEVDEEYMSSIIGDYAEISIRISQLKLNGIGGLDVDEHGSVIVGSDTEFSFPTGGRFSDFGPFRNLKERYLHVIERVLELIRNGLLYRARPILAYLVYLEVHRLVIHYAPLALEETEFYLEHPDSHCGNLLFSGKSISAYIDWEWQVTSTMPTKAQH